MFRYYIIIGCIVALVNARSIKEMFEGKFIQDFNEMLGKHSWIGRFIQKIFPGSLAIEMVLIWPVIVLCDITFAILKLTGKRRKAREVRSQLVDFYGRSINTLDGLLNDLEDIL